MEFRMVLKSTEHTETLHKHQTLEITTPMMMPLMMVKRMRMGTELSMQVKPIRLEEKILATKTTTVSRTGKRICLALNGMLQILTSVASMMVMNATLATELIHVILLSISLRVSFPIHQVQINSKLLMLVDSIQMEVLDSIMCLGLTPHLPIKVS